MKSIKRAQALLAATTGECPPCTDRPCLVQPCGYHCKYPYTDDSTMWVENCPACQERRVATDHLATRAKDLLAGYIDAVEALDGCAGMVTHSANDAMKKGKAKQAVADCERLFPEEAS